MVPIHQDRSVKRLEELLTLVDMRPHVGVPESVSRVRLAGATERIEVRAMCFGHTWPSIEQDCPSLLSGLLGPSLIKRRFMAEDNTRQCLKVGRDTFAPCFCLFTDLFWSCEVHRRVNLPDESLLVPGVAEGIWTLAHTVRAPT
jgi:hypothetical protein